MPQILGEVCDRIFDVKFVAVDGGEDNEDIVCGSVGEGVDDVEDEFG